jgi:hypothetical protein
MTEEESNTEVMEFKFHEQSFGTANGAPYTLRMPGFGVDLSILFEDGSQWLKLFLMKDGERGCVSSNFGFCVGAVGANPALPFWDDDFTEKRQYMMSYDLKEAQLVVAH